MRHSLAAAYLSGSRPFKAIETSKQNIADAERILGPDHPQTLLMRHSLAAAYSLALRPFQAIKLSKQNIADAERILGPDHPQTLLARQRIASSYFHTGRLHKAVTTVWKNAGIAKRTLEPGPSRRQFALARVLLTYAAFSIAVMSIPSVLLLVSGKYSSGISLLSLPVGLFLIQQLAPALISARCLMAFRRLLVIIRI
jgi:hypothetical protein